MAERDIVGGMFGITPEMYQRSIAAKNSADNLTAAQLTPGQLSGYYAMEAGTGLGRATQGLLGVEDPQMQLISRTNQLVQEIGIDTPEKLKVLAGELQKIPGGGQLAAQAIGQANKMLESAATVKQKSRENLPTPQTVVETNKLSSLQAKYPDTVEGRAKAADEFAEWKSSFKQKEAAAGSGAKTSDNALTKGRADKYLRLEDDAVNAGNTLTVVGDFKNVVNNAFTGFGADVKLTAGQVATALGVDLAGVPESEQLDRLLNKLTLGEAAKLKGAISDKDVLFLKKTIGTRGLTKATLLSVINELERDAKITKRSFEIAEENATADPNLGKLNFAKVRQQATEEVGKERKAQDEDAALGADYDRYAQQMIKQKKTPKTREQYIETKRKLTKG
jgi:hypothetical protein